MEPKSPVLCSQELSTGPYPEPDQPTPYNPILSLQNPYIIHRPVTWSS
jgi:hypothetical protein